jgi:hypothetical protein
MSSIRNYTHPEIVSGSTRFLIASGVACFYNDERFAPDSVTKASDTTAADFIYEYEPMHTPSWKHNWGVQITADEATRNQQITDGVAHGEYTGSIILDIRPAVQGRTSLGASRVFGGDRAYPITYMSSGNPSELKGAGGGPREKSYSEEAGYGYGPVHHYWPGGTSWKNIFPPRVTGKRPLIGEGNFGNFTNTNTADFVRNKIGASEYTSKNQFLLQVDTDVQDGRTRSFGGEPGEFNSSGTPQLYANEEDDTSIIESPYLLLPGDELVFGLDYLPGMVKYGLQANELSGSFIKLLSTGSAQVTFYGSFIQEGMPATPSLNQNLTSLAVHEVVGNDPVVDQYMIDPRTQYSGTYIDNLMRGAPGGPRGLYHGYESGSKRLYHSGNMQSQFRWRQSVVSNDSRKVLSTCVVVHLTGSRYSRAPANSTAWSRFGNTPHGGPVWGVKNRNISAANNPDDYISVHINGMWEGGLDEDGTSGSGIGDRKGYYYSRGNSSSRPLQSGFEGLVKPIPQSLLRGVRMATDNERYYDSLIPNLGQYARAHPGGVVYRPGNSENGTRRPVFKIPHAMSISHTGTLVPHDSAGIPASAGSVSSADFGGAIYVAGTLFDGGSWVSNVYRHKRTSYYPATAKGASFSIEPTGRAVYGKANTSWTESRGGDGSTPCAAADSVSTKPFNVSHVNYVNHHNYETIDSSAGNYSLGASQQSSINGGVYSGSLAFPFEMSPRRIAGNQKYMMMAFDSGDSVQSNMFIHTARQIRAMLFRPGINLDHSMLSIWNNPSDNVKIRRPNSPTGSTGNPSEEAVWRDGRGIHGMMFANNNVRYTAGLIHCAAKGHTTGTFVYYRPSEKYSNSCTGFRYGLINTEPMNTTAVFRHDTYGQFRDMLEQRPYTRFYKLTPKRRNRRRFRRIRSRTTNSTITRGPVTIRFKSTITGKTIKAVKTYSQNLSKVASSSLPYFDSDRDGKFRNRPYPFDDSILDSAVISEEDL